MSCVIINVIKRCVVPSPCVTAVEVFGGGFVFSQASSWQITDASQQTHGGKLLTTLAGDDLQGAIACTDDFLAAVALNNSYTVII